MRTLGCLGAAVKAEGEKPARAEQRRYAATSCQWWWKCEFWCHGQEGGDDAAKVELDVQSRASVVGGRGKGEDGAMTVHTL